MYCIILCWDLEKMRMELGTEGKRDCLRGNLMAVD